MKKGLITICITISLLFAASLFLHTNLFSYLYQKLYGYWSLVIVAFCYCLIAYSAAQVIYHAGRYAGYKKCAEEMLETVEESKKIFEIKTNQMEENINKSKTLLAKMDKSINEIEEFKNKLFN